MRKRFSRAEREVFVVGARVEWRNGSHWLPASVSAAFDKDSLGSERVQLRNEQATRTVGRGEVIYGYPGCVRPAA